MFALLKQTRTGFFIAMIGLMLTSIVSPVLALSASDLTPGDDATVVTATKLYSDSSRDADVTAEVAKDTPVSIVDGPFTASDGTQWFQVRVYDQTGYMPAVDLDGVATTDPATEAPADTATKTETAPTRPWQEPIDYGVANDNVKCRVDVSTTADELIRVATGQTIEITGKEVWSEGIAWLPVNCAGVGGFIAKDYITLDTATEVATEAPATETEVATEVATEAPAAAEVAETATEVATEAPAETQVATEAVATATDEALVASVADQVATETQVVEIPAAGPWLQPISVSVAIDDVVCRVDVSTSAPQITVVVTGQSVEITGAPITAEGLSWTPVNCAGVGGFVATQYIQAADEAAKAPATEETGTPAATDATTDQAAGAPAETATGTPVADETGTAEPTEVATDAAASPEATNAATEDATTPEATDEAAAATTTPEATDEATTPAATETPAAEEQLDSGQAVTETASSMPVADSDIIGTAEVQGTNGAGVACRTAADGSAPIIRVLPEGMNVLVLSTADANGWMSIVCNDQVGFAPAQYLYSGGAASDFSADKASYATVDGTAGTGLNCRSGPGTSYSVIGYFPAGSGVNVRGAAQGDWVPVVCGGQNGWVHGAYIIPASAPGGSTGNTGGNTATSGTMVVTGTNGDGLRCRTAPNGSVITVMAEGTRVSVRGATENGWVPIVCASQNGYASAQFLGSASTGDSGSTPPPSTGTPSSGTVTVSGTGGSRLNCRTAPNGNVITSVAEGTVLQVRGAAENGWTPVVCGGSNGWVSSMYVTAGGDLGSAPGGDSSSGDTGSGPDASTGTATVVNTDGDALRCRATPGGSTITMLAAGSTVALRAETSGDWQGVICAGQNGFASKAYLSIGGSGSNPTPTPAPSNPGGMGNGDHAKTTSSLNLRYEPNLGSGVATAAPAGTVVLITGGITNGFYPVNWDGLKGYMSGDYLVKTDEALSKRGGSGNDGSTGNNGGGGGATGNAIVDYAMGYLGYPYVWATHGPSSFDCSGFTYWVIKNVVGIDIGYGLWTQVSAGTPVSRSNLQPGDLVFFQNTYKSGLSHVGIYIGNDQFIHAENENTGVKISDLNSNYYGSRWYGAVRIG